MLICYIRKGLTEYSHVPACSLLLSPWEHTQDTLLEGKESDIRVKFPSLPHQASIGALTARHGSNPSQDLNLVNHPRYRNNLLFMPLQPWRACLCCCSCHCYIAVQCQWIMDIKVATPRKVLVFIYFFFILPSFRNLLTLYYWTISAALKNLAVINSGLIYIY